MRRGRIAVLGVVVAAVGVGALLIPSGGGALDSNQRFVAAIEQNGAPVETVLVANCPTPTSTTGSPRSPVSALTEGAASLVGGSTGLSADHIDVIFNSARVGAITTMGTPALLSFASPVPCSGTGDFLFQPKTAAGSDTLGGTPQTVRVAFVGSPS